MTSVAERIRRRRSRGQVTPVRGGCQLALRTELFPYGALRVLSPLLRRAMRRNWEQDLARWMPPPPACRPWHRGHGERLLCLSCED